MDFVTIDVETANADYSSICQIGLVEYQGGQIVSTWSTLINPKSFFDPFNSHIHGITEIEVQESPTFDQIYDELTGRLTGTITVHHMPFDRIAISRVCAEHDLEEINTRWLDSAKIVRRTWSEFSAKGYGLKNIADHLGITFDHHDALQDAIATTKVVEAALVKAGNSIEDWIELIRKPVSYSVSTRPKTPFL